MGSVLGKSLCISLPIVGYNSKTVSCLCVPHTDLSRQATAGQQHAITSQTLNVLRRRYFYTSQSSFTEETSLHVDVTLTMLWPLSSRGEISLMGGE